MDLDITDLVGVLDDRDPQAIFDEWVAAVTTADPTWQPVNGAVETIVAEALCTTVADVIYAVNRLPGIVVEALLALKDIPRHPGSPAAGTVTITLDGTRTVTVPAGARMMIDGLEYTADSTIAATGDHIDVPVTCTEASALGNGLPEGTGVDLLDPDPYAVHAATTGVFSGGSDPETSAAYLARCALTFPIDAQGLGLPSAFVAWTAGLADVSRAAAVDAWDPDSGNDPGEDGGHITVYAHGPGAALTSDRLDEITDDLSGRALSILTVHVEPVTVITVPVTMTVRLAPGAAAGTVLPAVEAALAAAISPTVWEWGEPVTPEECAAIAARVPGVDYALSVTAPGTAVDLPTGALPAAGTLTITAG